MCAHSRWETEDITTDPNEIEEAGATVEFDEEDNIKPVEVGCYSCLYGEDMDPYDMMYRPNECNHFTTLDLPDPYCHMHEPGKIWYNIQMRHWGRVLGWPEIPRINC